MMDAEINFFRIKHKSELEHLDYKCAVRLSNLRFYQDVFEHLWLWEKPGSPPLITLGEGDGWISVVPLRNVRDINDKTWVINILSRIAKEIEKDNHDKLITERSSK